MLIKLIKFLNFKEALIAKQKKTVVTDRCLIIIIITIFIEMTFSYKNMVFKKDLKRIQNKPKSQRH